MEGITMNTFTKLIKQSILAATLLGIATPIFAGQGQTEQPKQKDNKPVVVDKRSGLSPLAFAGCCVGGAAALYGMGTLLGRDMHFTTQDICSLFSTLRQQSDLNTLTATGLLAGCAMTLYGTKKLQEQEISFLRKEIFSLLIDHGKESDLSKLATAGLIAGGAATLYGAGKLVGKDLNLTQQEIFPLVAESLSGKRNKELSIATWIRHSILPPVKKSGSNLKTDLKDVSCALTKDILTKIGIRPEDTIINNADNSLFNFPKVSSYCSILGVAKRLQDEKLFKIPSFISLLNSDLKKLYSPIEEEKRQGEFVLGHEATHIREMHVQKRIILGLSLTHFFCFSIKNSQFLLNSSY
jgi:hypothetical protein